MADAPSAEAAATTAVCDPCPRLSAVRAAMRLADGGLGVDAFIVPTEDPHMVSERRRGEKERQLTEEKVMPVVRSIVQSAKKTHPRPPSPPQKKPYKNQSEYPAPSDGRREWLTRFTGSAGTAVVTLAHGALLWTDGRYFLQAEKQLKRDEWTLMRSGLAGVAEPPEWLAASLPRGARVGIDPALHTVEGARKLRRALEAAGCALVPLDAPPSAPPSPSPAGKAPPSPAAPPRHPPSSNPVDLSWGASGESPRPDPPSAPVRIHPALWAGEAAAEKLARMRARMAAAGAGALLVTALDEVAWLLNLRGGDVPHNPVFLGYAVVTRDAATLFTDEAKLGGGGGEGGEAAAERLRAHLAAAGVGVAAYAAAAEGVARAAREAASAGLAVWADPSKVSFALFRAAEAAAAAAADGGEPAAKRAKKQPPATATATATAAAAVRFVEKPSPVTAAKALKNDAELAGMAEAHARDSVALAQTLRWLEEEVGLGLGGEGAAATRATVRETDVDEFVTSARARQPGFVEPSFPTIAGVDGNGAVIHYRAEEGTPTNRACLPGSLLLLDSGGQYDCGTTDVTRTVWLGASSSSATSTSTSPPPPPPAEIVEAFTRVLQGHIALDSAVFPEGTPGLALDTLARSALWRLGLNYRHGTGHGVGAALNVHEGPQSISTRLHVHTPLDARMVVSNEPGFYRGDGEGDEGGGGGDGGAGKGGFGIRIENLVAVEEAATKHRFGGQRYFRFRKLTLAPLQRALIDVAALTAAEADWVDAYHSSVRSAVLPRLRACGDEATARWLVAATEPLSRPSPSASSSAASVVGGGGGGAEAGGCVVDTAPEPVGVGAK